MPKPTAAERTRRLIALLGSLQTEGRSHLSPLAESLGISVSELAEDLVTLSMCGVAPYDPLALVPVMVSGDEYEVFGDLPAISGPVRLSVTEANALVAALQAAGFDAADPLTARLMIAVSDADSTENIGRVIRAAIDSHDTDVYKAIASSAEAHEVIEIDHAGAEQYEISTRTVEPTGLFAERGAWYLRAWCRDADGWRTFRLDRIVEVRPTGASFEPREDHMHGGYEALEFDKLPTATLVFSEGRPFDEREWPGGRATGTSEDGGTLAEVPYAGYSWIARRVVGELGDVEVLAPAELRAQVAALASRILADEDA